MLTLKYIYYTLLACFASFTKNDGLMLSTCESLVTVMERAQATSPATIKQTAVALLGGICKSFREHETLLEAVATNNNVASAKLNGLDIKRWAEIYSRLKVLAGE